MSSTLSPRGEMIACGGLGVGAGKGKFVGKFGLGVGAAVVGRKS
jgi:hypothetical protein